MGIGLSVDTYLDDSPNAAKAAMVFSYEKQSLVPLVFTDFLVNPSSFVNPLIIIQPINAKSPPFVKPQITGIPYAEAVRNFHSNFKIQNYKFENQFIWVLNPVKASKAICLEMMNFIRKAPLAKYSSKACVDCNAVFTDFNSSITFNQAMRPPSSSSSVRCSSPLRAAGSQMCGASSLLTRRSHNPPCIGTFRLPSIPTTCSDARKEEQFNVPRDEMNLICEGIFVGSERAAANKKLLLDNGITHIINLSGYSTAEHFKDTFQYFTVKMRDNDFEDIPPTFWEALNFLKRAKASGGITLVHCRMGICRSAALVAAYLSEEKGITIDAALNFMKARRPDININPGFLDQLHNRESSISHSSAAASPLTVTVPNDGFGIPHSPAARSPSKRSKPRLLIP